MSNLIINWRFGAYHLQVTRRSDWASHRRAGIPIVRWSYNAYHARNGPARRKGFWSPVAIHQGWRYVLLLAALIALIVVVLL